MCAVAPSALHERLFIEVGAAAGNQQHHWHPHRIFHPVLHVLRSFIRKYETLAYQPDSRPH